MGLCAEWGWVGWPADAFSAMVTQCDEATSCSKRKVRDVGGSRKGGDGDWVAAKHTRLRGFAYPLMCGASGERAGSSCIMFSESVMVVWILNTKAIKHRQNGGGGGWVLDGGCRLSTGRYCRLECRAPGCSRPLEKGSVLGEFSCCSDCRKRIVQLPGRRVRWV